MGIVYSGLYSLIYSMFLSRRFFHRLPFLFKNRPFLLADIGEGITEVEVIQWYTFDDFVVIKGL